MRLQRRFVVVLGGGDGIQDGGEQLGQIGSVGHVAISRARAGGAASLGGGIDDREIDLRLVGVEVEEKFVGLVNHIGDAGIGTVHLVDHHDDRQVLGQRLAQYEAGLGQWPLAGVDEQNHAVDHLQAALHLTAEIRVTGGVDDVDGGGLAVGRDMPDGRVLGQDRDALFPLQIHGVHHPVSEFLMGAEGPGLAQHGVHQCGLSMIDVGDDRDVAQVAAHCVGHPPMVSGAPLPAATPLATASRPRRL